MVRASLALALVAAVGIGSAGADAATRPGRLGPSSAPIQPSTHVEAIAASHGRVVLAGSSGFGGGRNHTTFVHALGPDLKPDPTFGTAGEITFEPDGHDPRAVAIEPDGQILLVRGGTLYRLNRDGSTDSSFGPGGAIDVSSDDAVAGTTLSLYADGRILVAGFSWTGDNSQPSHLHVYRYLPDGSPDEGFGSHGHVEQVAPGPNTGAAAALQPDGGVILLGLSYPGPSIMRLRPNGDPDADFGQGGLAAVELASPHLRNHLYPIGAPLVTARGRVRIPVTFGERESVMRFGLVGLTAGGKVDRRFGRRGLALGPDHRFAEGGENASDAALDRRGNLLMAGSISHFDDLSGDDASIVRRFHPNGKLDRSFGHAGVMRVAPPSGAALEQLLATSDGDTAVLASQETLSRYGHWGGGVLRTFGAGYDDDEPEIHVTSGCRRMRVHVRDASPLDRLVVRENGHVVRHTTRKRVRLHVRPRLRVSITAVDAAGNVARTRSSMPRC